jgi:hypothetical protein
MGDKGASDKRFKSTSLQLVNGTVKDLPSKVYIATIGSACIPAAELDDSGCGCNDWGDCREALSLPLLATPRFFALFKGFTDLEDFEGWGGRVNSGMDCEYNRSTRNAIVVTSLLRSRKDMPTVRVLAMAPTAIVVIFWLVERGRDGDSDPGLYGLEGEDEM